MTTEVKRFTIWENNGKTTNAQSTYRIVKESENSFYLELLVMGEDGFHYQRINNDELGWSAVSWLVTSDTFQKLFVN